MKTDSYIYNAFGEVEHKDGSTKNNYLFTGEQYDPNLGFYYLRARYYNQNNGRFFSLDTYQGRNSDPKSLHKYLYTHADPINNIDPTGNFSLGGFAVGTGIVAVLANTAITSYSFGRAANDSDGLPDAVSVSFRGGLAKGVGGSFGGDLVYDFKTGDLWAFAAGEFTIAPLTAFRPQGKFNISATAGLVWNMNSPKQFNGAGSTATWPIGTAHLLTRAGRVSTATRGGFWGVMTQTAKFAKNHRSWSLQFGFSGFSGEGPAFARIGKGSSFSSDFFGLAEGRKITGSRAPLVNTIERLMKSLRGSNSPQALESIIRRVEAL
ncbi:RHS repeat-associated core domain-containing protein [Kangiella sediminilitoris]|uniref:RHS repeat-associated core domain-containing protein n=1 Tax=Kangiella sediminilitoris TaxID=1144748 RepID=UPI001E4CA053|nr:RHS repeat-associated core domain-containing protein [Kangiella sediminilitoris]